MFSNRISSSYIGTFKRGNSEDEKALTEVKNMVHYINKCLRQSDAKDRFGALIQYRVCVKGRRPYKKFFNKLTGRMNSYNFAGDIVGGIKNASEVDAYIYRRSN